MWRPSSSPVADDLRAWCRALAGAKSWKAALAAYEEAAAIVGDEAYARGEFLDGAALAAQELARKDLPARLERAWRERPTLMRLRRWLGAAPGKAALKKRAEEALEACPRKASRQRALLHVLLGDIGSAAKVLATAPGLGWSDSEHPGHLVFPLFHALVGGGALAAVDATDGVRVRGMDIDELELMAAAPEERRLLTPKIADIVGLAGAGTPPDTAARTTMLAAMRKAAEKRLAGVTANKRRGHYGHAAELARACVEVDATPASAAWFAGIRDAYRRFPALQSELARKPGAA